MTTTNQEVKTGVFYVLDSKFDVVFDDILAEIWHCETLLSSQEDLAKEACDSMHLHN